MTTNRADPLRDEAATWLARTGDPAFDGWDDFTRWLEEDPAHAEAYQAVAESATMFDSALIQVEREAAELPEPRRAWRWAVAAGVAAFGALGLTVGPQLRGTTYQTAPGEMKTITLAAGDTLVLNGGTSLRVRQFMGRRVTLDHGQVLLRLNGHHDAVTVASGDLEMVDVGTVFEVTRAKRSTRVAVSEGVVMADPSSARLRIPAGQRLDADDGDPLLKVEPAPPGSVGGWAEGQLTYVAEPIARVAADLERSTGMDFSVDPAMRHRPFSGTLSVAGVRRDPLTLGPLLDASVRRSSDQWIIEQGSRGSNVVPPVR